MATQQTGSKRREPTPNRGSTARSVEAAPAGSGTVERDEVYGLISVLYHALQGAETYGKYIEDARRGNDSELLEFFQECKTEENERAQRAKRLLAMRLDDVDEDDDDEDEDDEEDEEDED